jgi:hypothetical protein
MDTWWYSLSGQSNTHKLWAMVFTFRSHLLQQWNLYVCCIHNVFVFYKRFREWSFLWTALTVLCVPCRRAVRLVRSQLHLRCVRIAAYLWNLPLSPSPIRVQINREPLNGSCMEFDKAELYSKFSSRFSFG